MENQVETTIPEKKKRGRKPKSNMKSSFYLFNPEKGFLCEGDESTNNIPNFSTGKFFVFNSIDEAKMLRDFFVKIKIASTLDIFSKVG